MRMASEKQKQQKHISQLRMACLLKQLKDNPIINHSLNKKESIYKSVVEFAVLYNKHKGI